MKALSLPNLIKSLVCILIFCFITGGTAAAQMEEGDTIYLYGRNGEIKGFETKDYLYSMEGEIIGYKVRDKKFVYVYSPEGDRIGYRHVGLSQDSLYFYDAEGNIIGYYSGSETDKPSFKEEPLYKPDLP